MSRTRRALFFAVPALLIGCSDDTETPASGAGGELIFGNGASAGAAGAAAAAALAQLDYRVLIVEPGLDHSRRLAGELIHPPGVADLSTLGLLSCLQSAGGVPVHGFAMFAGGTQVLPYAEVVGLKNDGLSMEHGTIAASMLDAVEKRDDDSRRDGSRIDAAESLGEPGCLHGDEQEADRLGEVLDDARPGVELLARQLECEAFVPDRLRRLAPGDADHPMSCEGEPDSERTSHPPRPQHRDAGAHTCAGSETTFT